MIVTELSFNPQEGVTNEWLLRHWDSDTPTGVTEERFPHVEAGTDRIIALFSADADVNAVLLDRARAAVLATNATTINTNKATLRAAEGL